MQKLSAKKFERMHKFVIYYNKNGSEEYVYFAYTRDEVEDRLKELKMSTFYTNKFKVKKTSYYKAYKEYLRESEKRENDILTEYDLVDA